MKAGHETQIVERNADSLEFHPLLSRIALPDEVIASLKKRKVKKAEHRTAIAEITEDRDAFFATLDAEGIKDTIKITKNRIVCDGRNRVLWARARGIKMIRCEIVSDDEARRIIETMMIGKRQMTKAMRAYAAVLLHPEVVQGGKAGPKPKNDESDESAYSVGRLSRRDLAAKYGVAPGTIDQACKIYEAFDISPALRTKHEHLVWAGFGLGGIIAGLAGDRTDQSITQMDFFSGLFRRFNAFGGSLLESWEKTETDEQKELVADALGNFLARIPQDLREQAARRISHFTDPPTH